MIHLYLGTDYGYTCARAKADLMDGLTDDEKKEVIQYDGYKDPVSLLNDDLVSLSLFGEKKRILFTGAYFLSSDRSGKKEGPIPEKEQDYDRFLSYCEHPEGDDDLYLAVPGNIDAKSKIVEAIRKNGRLHSLETISQEDFVAFAMKKASEERKKIERKAAEMIYERTKGDYLAFKNNLDKVLTYTSNVKVGDVDKLVYQPLEEDVFEVVKASLRGDTERAIRFYEDLRRAGNDASMILSVMASQFRFFSLVAFFQGSREDNEAIASEISGGSLKVSKGRIYYAKKDLGNVSFHTLLRILSDLGTIEQNQRKNQDNPDTWILLFLTDFRKNYLR